MIWSSMDATVAYLEKKLSQTRESAPGHESPLKSSVSFGYSKESLHCLFYSVHAYAGLTLTRL